MTPFGDRALRFAIPPEANRRAILRALRGVHGVSDVVLAEEIGCVVFERRSPPPAASVIASAIAAAVPLVEDTAREHVLPVAYDGEDLEEVARSIGRTKDAVVALHAGADYRVAMLGFLPGFAYLVGLPEVLQLPRRAPRPRVPPRSVAIAAHYTGIYPLASPGGWHLLGRVVDFTPWDAAHGAALGVGDRVRFQPVAAKAPLPIAAGIPATALASATPHLEVTRIAGLALPVDAGRPGRMFEGVPPGGPLVRRAHERANALVGNPPSACTLELAGTLEVTARGGRLAIASEAGRIDLADGERHRFSSGGAARVTYVSIAGGIDAPLVLGGRGALLVAGIGRPLRRGDRITTLSSGERPETPSAPPEQDSDVTPAIEVLPGPDVPPEGLTLETVLARTFTVSSSSDRTGTRLAGFTPRLPKAAPASRRPSTPMVIGAIELTPSGLIVLGPDHPTTGGYPVIGVVRSGSLDDLFERPLGSPVELRPTTRPTQGPAAGGGGRT